MKEELIISKVSNPSAQSDYFALFKNALFSSEGLVLIGLLALVIAMSMMPSSGAKGKLAKGRLGGKAEKNAAQKKAISQIEEKKHNEVSLYLGRPGTGSLIFLPDLQRGAMAIGGAGCGKTDSVLLPMIYSAIEQGLPCIVWDFKYPALTSRLVAYAVKKGYKVELFAPGYQESSVCNPLDFLKGPDDSLMARQFAETLNRNFKKGGQTNEDAFFGPAGDQLVEAILMLAKGIKGEDGQSIADLITCQSLLSLPNLPKRIMQHQAEINPWAYASFGQLISTVDSEKTVASIIATANRQFTAFMKGEILPAFCGKSTIDLDLTGKKLLVIGLDREKRDVIAPLVATILDLIVSRNVVKPRKDPLMVFLDEVPTLYLPRLSNWLNENREDGLCTVLAAQNFVQLEQIYGKELARAIFGGCATKILFNPQEPESAEFLAKLFDDEQIEFKQTSRSSGKGGGSTNVSEQNQTRKLITSGEILKFPTGKAVIISPGFEGKGEAYLPIIENIKLSPAYKKLKKLTVNDWPVVREKMGKRGRQKTLSDQDLQKRNQFIETRFSLDTKKPNSKPEKTNEDWMKLLT